MRFFTYGNKENKKLILIHGFLSPRQIWEEYIERYKKEFYVIVPVLPCHGGDKEDKFTSFEDIASEIEDYCLNAFGNDIFAVYAMSMGGAVASLLLKNGVLKICKLVMESSPVLPYGRTAALFMTNFYINIVEKARKRDKKTLNRAVESMVTKEHLEDFLTLLDNISNGDMRAYVNELGKIKFPVGISSNTEIYYLYGGKMGDIAAKNCAKFIKKNYNSANITVFKGKGHCEDALLNASERIKFLDGILK